MSKDKETIEYLDYNFRAKPIDKLIIGTAYKESTKDKVLDLAQFSYTLKKYSKGLRNKLYFEAGADMITVKAENVNTPVRATLYSIKPDWAI